MSSKKETTYYMELQPGDAVQDGDQWLDSFGQWQPYVCKDQISGVVFSGVKARRPIGKTNRTTYEEVPGSRTTQNTVVQPQRERIAYEELRPGDKIQPGDEWKNGDGRWQPYVCLTGLLQFVQDGHAARRPYRVNTIIIDALADAHAATAQLQNERDEARAAIAQVKAEFNSQADVLAEVREALAAEQGAHKVTMASGLEACKERDEARAERDKLKGLIDDLLDEPTAKRVQDMLRTWATELDWSAGCFGSFGRSQIDIIQQTMVAVIQRIETMINPEGDVDGN